MGGLLRGSIYDRRLLKDLTFRFMGIQFIGQLSIGVEGFIIRFLSS